MHTYFHTKTYMHTYMGDKNSNAKTRRGLGITHVGIYTIPTGRETVYTPKYVRHFFLSNYN